MAIKPGLCNICMSKYTKDQIKKYLLKIKNMDVKVKDDMTNISIS